MAAFSKFRQLRRIKTSILLAACWGSGTAWTTAAWGQSHPGGVPALKSLPGAGYTIYLDFAGFSFTGNWGNGGGVPGVTPAFDGITTTFGTSDQSYIDKIWARVAEKYAAFGVNVTTVDPAVAAGLAGSDAQRQLYYDETAKLMHTVVGDNSWTNGGGVSYVGVTESSFGSDPNVNGGNGIGYHTNWILPNHLGGSGNVSVIAEAGSHENGHGLNLNHQSDYNGATLVNEYSSNNSSVGNGSFAPVMGNSYNAQRGLWRSGTVDAGGLSQQDDVATILGNGGIGPLTNDGVGHSLGTATLLPLSGSNVDFTQAKGIIVPASSTTPNPTGVANYTSDLFAFHSAGGSVSLTVHDGGERITPGVADGGATLISTLSILNSSGTVLYTAANNPATLSETITQSLAAGQTYYAQITSAGGESGTFDGSTNYYYDMGSFFLTGSGVIGTSNLNFYWMGGASTSKWTQVDGGITSNWRNNHVGGTDPATGPSATTNVFFTVDSGATNLTTTLGGNQTINSLNFTGTGSTAGIAPVTIAADGSTLSLAAATPYSDAASNLYPVGTGLVVQAGSAAHTIAANVALVSSQTWQINNAPNNPLTISGVISGIGSGLTLSGSGQVVLANSNSYSGPTTLNIGTTLTITAAGSLPSGGALVDSGTVNFNSALSGGILHRNEGVVTINANAKLNLLPATIHANRTQLTAAAVTLSGLTNAWTSTLDLANNDLVIQNGNLATTINQIKSGYANGIWNGNGIKSSSAAADSTHLTALGVILNGTIYGTTGSLGLFDGISPGAGDVLVKYTYFGDANLDGKVDGSDYSLLDNGYHNQLTGWYNGDFNYDGVIDGSDYTLVDNSFNTQGVSLAGEIFPASAGPAPRFEASSPVPEPVSCALLLIPGVAMLSRRRKA